MTIKQIEKAIQIALDNTVDTSRVNTEPLHGICCIGAQPVMVTLFCVGVFLKDFVMWNGRIDDEAINDMRWTLRNRVSVLE